MNRSSRLFLASMGCLLFLLSRSTAARADHVIDAFTDEFNYQRCGGVGPLWPILWAGELVGTGTNPVCSDSQSTLSGVIRGHRYATVQEPTLSNFVTASMSTEPDGQPALSYSTTGPAPAPSGMLTLEYGKTNDLNLNLSADRAFELTFNGDMDSSPTRPVKLTISVRSGTGPVISASKWVVQDGVYQIPFTSFTGMTFSDVDYVKVTVDATTVSGVDFDMIGGVRTVP